MTLVSQETIAVKPCSCGCGRPRDREGQRYRKDCHTEYMRHRRAGMVERLLTPAEWALIVRERERRSGAR